MAFKQTAAGGDWTVGSNWVGGVAPITGDDVKVNHGMTNIPSPLSLNNLTIADTSNYSTGATFGTVTVANFFMQSDYGSQHFFSGLTVTGNADLEASLPSGYGTPLQVAVAAISGSLNIKGNLSYANQGNAYGLMAVSTSLTVGGMTTLEWAVNANTGASLAPIAGAGSLAFNGGISILSDPLSFTSTSDLGGDFGGSPLDRQAFSPFAGQSLGNSATSGSGSGSGSGGGGAGITIHGQFNIARPTLIVAQGIIDISNTTINASDNFVIAAAKSGNLIANSNTVGVVTAAQGSINVLGATTSAAGTTPQAVPVTQYSAPPSLAAIVAALPTLAAIKGILRPGGSL